MVKKTELCTMKPFQACAKLPFVFKRQTATPSFTVSTKSHPAS